MALTARCIYALAIAAFAAMPAADGADSDILLKLEQALGQQDAQAVRSRMDGLRSALRPICASMPHNEQGRMGPSVVRYVLHRLFMQRGWSVLGLEPTGQGWSAGSPARMLGHDAPGHLVELFEERLSGPGLDLEEAAALAATFLSTVVRREMLQNLEAAYRALELEREGSLGEEAAFSVLDAYAAGYVLGKNLSSLPDWEIRRLDQRAPREYHSMPQVRELARGIKKSLVGGGAVDFSQMEHIAEQLGERIGPDEDENECGPRRRDLLKLERRGSGRVPLSDFYRAALHEGKWHFGESSGYLRQLGALDDTDAGNLQVIIPNYINSKSNCVDASRYYSVCCMNECDQLFGSLEREVGSPSATTAEVARIVASMGSPTVPGNRTLSPALLQRLEEVADGNGGRVPLHGRLFAQWMHHAYPRECSFPHISGTTAPVRVEDWAAEPGNEVVASREEMHQHASAARPEQGHPENGEDDDGECAPWMEHEEILAPHAPHDGAGPAAQRSPASAVWWIASVAALLMALSTGAVRLAAPKSGGKNAAGKDLEQPGDLPIVYAV